MRPATRGDLPRLAYIVGREGRPAARFPVPLLAQILLGGVALGDGLAGGGEIPVTYSDLAARAALDTDRRHAARLASAALKLGVAGLIDVEDSRRTRLRDAQSRAPSRQSHSSLGHAADYIWPRPRVKGDFRSRGIGGLARPVRTLLVMIGGRRRLLAEASGRPHRCAAH